MSLDILVVYNTCGKSGLEPNEQIFTAIRSMLLQDKSNMRILWSSVYNDEFLRDAVGEEFGDRISHCYIDAKVPVPVSFNRAVQKFHEEVDSEVDRIMYVDSGVRFLRTDDIRLLYDVADRNDVGMVSARSLNDDGYWDNLKVGRFRDDHDSYESEMFKGKNYIVPVGKAVNLHCQIFSSDIYDYYGRCYTDVFAGYASESVFSFICAALGLKWIVSRNVVVDHLRIPYSNSCMFPPHEHVAKGGKSEDYGFCVDSVIEICKRGQEYGLGLEELAGTVMHDPSKFDKNGFATDPRLKQFIRDNLFLTPDKFDYNKLEAKFIP